MKMKSKVVITIILFFLVAENFVLYSQFTEDELKQRESLEIVLKTARMTKYKDVGRGITRPIRIYLDTGPTERSGIWKNPSGKMNGVLEGWQYEIAAYRMDKLLGLNMIAPTVEREFMGKRGSYQLWITGIFDELYRENNRISIPVEKRDHINKMKYMTRAFDNMIANTDRTKQNTCFTKDWRLILIDHSRSFRTSERFTKQIIYGKYGIRRRMLMRTLPRDFVEKIRALDFRIIKNAVGPYLTDEEIRAVLARQKIILKEIDEMIREQGEDKVLYD
jgi:hypothetical protein